MVGFSRGLSKRLAVLDVAAEVADPGVEDVVEGVLAQEEVADDAHAPRVFVVHPKSAQVRYRVYCLLYLAHLAVEVLEGHAGVQAHLAHHFLVLLDEGDYGLPVILGDVLRLVL